MKIEYKFNEAELIKQLQLYIDSTYDQHYSKNKFQATEFILDAGHGEGFTIGNIMKYAQRYGKKDGYNRKDLMKVLHYALIAMHQHDLNQQENKVEPERAECDFTTSYSYKYNTTYNGANSETK